MLAVFVEKIINLVFPLTCISCEREGAWICADCRERIPYATNLLCPNCFTFSPGGYFCTDCRKKSSLDGLWIISSYEYRAVKDLVHMLKYSGVTSVLDDIQRIAQPALRHLAEASESVRRVFMPIPLHEKRLRDRGFNQSALLAKMFAVCLNGRYVADGLLRTKETGSQALLSKDERITNVQDAFTASSALAISGKHVMLVDDVATTCATLQAAARVLRQHGARTVWGLAVARGTLSQL